MTTTPLYGHQILMIIKLIVSVVVIKMLVNVLKDDSPDIFSPRKTLDKGKADEWNRLHPDDPVEV